jgi:hypothetical protein
MGLDFWPRSCRGTGLVLDTAMRAFPFQHGNRREVSRMSAQYNSESADIEVQADCKTKQAGPEATIQMPASR